MIDGPKADGAVIEWLWFCPGRLGAVDGHAFRGDARRSLCGMGDRNYGAVAVDQSIRQPCQQCVRFARAGSASAAEEP